MSQRRAPIGELPDAHLTPPILGRLRPRLAGMAVADVKATQSERPPHIGKVPQGRVGPRIVVAKEMEKDPLSLRLKWHGQEPRLTSPSDGSSQRHFKTMKSGQPRVQKTTMKSAVSVACR